MRRGDGLTSFLCRVSRIFLRNSDVGMHELPFLGIVFISWCSVFIKMFIVMLLRVTLLLGYVLIH